MKLASGNLQKWAQSRKCQGIFKNLWVHVQTQSCRECYTDIPQHFECNTTQLFALPKGRYCTKRCAISVLFNDFCLLSHEYEEISSVSTPQSLNNNNHRYFLGKYNEGKRLKYIAILARICGLIAANAGDIVNIDHLPVIGLHYPKVAIRR